ncbi:MAG TPA: IS66 family transposase [Pyrinomonadaceae bacterium]|nr:IS66 family transposase [Pyrinomonadaceae bacterium]
MPFEHTCARARSTIRKRKDYRGSNNTNTKRRANVASRGDGSGCVTRRRGVFQRATRRASNHALQRRLAELGTRLGKDSHNSSLPPSSDPPVARRTRRLRRRTGRKVGGQTGQRGATLRPVAPPDEVITHAPAQCRACGDSLDPAPATRFERRQVFEAPPARLLVTEHRAETRRCAFCGTATEAQFPAGVSAPAQYGRGLRARAAYLHQYQLLPLARTAEALSDLFGCRLSAGTVHRMTVECAEALSGAEAGIKDAVTAALVIGADETGLRVAGESHWVHVARTDHLTHYACSARRGKEAMDSVGILPAFTGTVVSDALCAYRRHEQSRHALCNAHLLRELIYIKEVCAEQQQWTDPLAKLLLRMKAAAVRVRAAGGRELSAEQRAQFCRRYDRLVTRAAELNPVPTPPPPPGKGLPLRKVPKPARKKNPALPLVKRLRECRQEVLRFVTDLTVPFDNNGSERDLRMVKLQQKTSGCFRTAAGAERFCRIRSNLSSARKQGQPLLAAIEQAFEGGRWLLPPKP